MIPLRLPAVPLVLLVLVLAGCKEGLVEPERFGSIQGQVLDYETGTPIAGAGVTTSPATNALTSSGDGTFSIEEALTGTYTITASRSGYTPNTVTVAVREGQAAQAALFLRPQTEDDTTTAIDFGAEVLSFTNEPFEMDSSFVTVEYRALNNGDATVTSYEIYFRIDTDRGPFYQEVQGTDLGPGQRDFGTFRKRLLGATAEAVVVEDTAVNGGLAREATPIDW